MLLPIRDQCDLAVASLLFLIFLVLILKCYTFIINIVCRYVKITIYNTVVFTI